MNITQPKGPRFPDPRLEQVQFNKAIVEVLKQEYRDRTALEARIISLQERVGRIESKNKEGSRPPNRYFLILEDLN